jgi:hypothetical protein
MSALFVYFLENNKRTDRLIPNTRNSIKYLGTILVCHVIPDYDKTVFVRPEVLTVVTMKNAVFWHVTQCGSCKNRRFRGT